LISGFGLMIGYGSDNSYLTRAFAPYRNHQLAFSLAAFTLLLAAGHLARILFADPTEALGEAEAVRTSGSPEA